MLHNVASFFSFSTHAPLYGVTLAQSKGSVARAASTHAPAIGATESTNRIGVAGGRFNSRTPVGSDNV